MYLKNATIYCDKDHKKQFEASKNDFMMFLERDERFNKKSISNKIKTFNDLAKSITVKLGNM